MSEPLPDDVRAVMKASQQVLAIRHRVLAECRRARAIVELGGMERVRRLKPARWQFGRSRFA